MLVSVQTPKEWQGISKSLGIVNFIEEHNLIECPDLYGNRITGDSGDSSVKLKQDQSLIMNYNSINALIFYNREEVKPVVHNQTQLSSHGRNCSMREYDLLNKEKLGMVKARAKLARHKNYSEKPMSPPPEIKKIGTHPKQLYAIESQITASSFFQPSIKKVQHERKNTADPALIIGKSYPAKCDDTRSKY